MVIGNSVFISKIIFRNQNDFENKSYFSAHFTLGPMTQATLVYSLRKVVCLVYHLRSLKLWCSMKISQTLWRCDQGRAHTGGFIACMNEETIRVGAKLKWSSQQIVSLTKLTMIMWLWGECRYKWKKRPWMGREGKIQAALDMSHACLKEQKRCRTESVMVD